MTIDAVQKSAYYFAVRENGSRVATRDGSAIRKPLSGGLGCDGFIALACPLATTATASTLEAFSRTALRAISRACMGRAEENTAVIAIVDPLYTDKPEGLAVAWFGAASETGKPKVVDTYPPRVSGDLIRERRAQDNKARAGQTTGGLVLCLFP